MTSQVAVLRTRPECVVADYGRLLRLAKYDQVLAREQDLILKLNLSWTKYFPACSSQPWQLDGVVKTLLDDGYDRRRIFPVENKTVVTDPVKGARNNKWLPVLERHGLRFIPLTEVEWTVYHFKTPLLKLNELFPEGIEIPRMYVGKNVLHMPTVKCVHPDTEILLADGSLVRAEALVKEWQVREPAYDLPDGDRVAEGEAQVVSLGPEGLGGAWATHFWRTPVAEGTIWNVRTRTGRQVTTSSRHPFLTPGGWKPASELRVGDRIAVARHIRIEGESQPLPRVPALGHERVDVDRLPLRPGRRYDVDTQRRIIRDYVAGKTITAIASELQSHWQGIGAVVHRYGIASRWRRTWARVPERTSPEFWRWMGYFIAEGYAYDTSGSFRVCFWNTRRELREDYIELCRSLFGVDPKTRANEIYFDALNLRSFFEALGFRIPTSAGNKAVPESLFRCPDHEIASFAQAYLDGDGSVGPSSVRAPTKSPRLAAQLQMLLSRLGVLAFRSTMRSRPRRDKPSADYALISIYGDDVGTLAQWVRLRSPHKQQRLDRLAGRGKADTSRSRWDSIPVPAHVFRRVRTGIGLTAKASKLPEAVKCIERRRLRVTRSTLNHFLQLFAHLDTCGAFADDIAYLRFLAAPDIAWDRVVEIHQPHAEVPFFYDMSVRDAECFIGNSIILHNTHGHAVTTGAIKNSFGGLLKEVRHYAHEFIHEVMVDLLLMQRELHPGVFAIMDGTVMGDGAGPRTMIPRDGNLLLASADQVAIDAIAAQIMGFAPLAIPYLRMCHERGLGVADPRRIELVGDVDAAAVRMGFRTRRSPVIWGDQLIRRGPLRPLKRLLLHSPLVIWAPFASNVYHDFLWYPTIGRARRRAFAATPWGRLFDAY